MFQKKVKLFNYVIIIFFILSIGKIFHTQILNGHIYKRLSQQQSYILKKTHPQRGQIFDSDNTPLITNHTKYQISLYKPNMDISQEDLLALFEGELEEKDSQLINNFYQNENQKWIELSSYFDKDLINKFSQIEGVIANPYQIRFYPELDMGKDFLGFLAKNRNGFLTGYGGLEGYYNQRLSGRTGFLWQSRDAVGQLVFSNLSWSKPKIDGTNLHTFISRQIQFIVENEIKKSLIEFQAESVSALIIESKTGAVLAMATAEASPSASHKNRIISDLYEPGSIFKPLTVAIGLDSKSIDQDFLCPKCNQNRTIDGHQITNWDFQNHPDSTLYDIIKNSDNIGMSYIMDEIEFDTFLKYAYKLGLNQKTGIDLQGEAKPNFDKKFWSKLEKSTTSFGQGFAISNIQMTTAFNTLANNGLLVKPRIVNYFQEQDQIKHTSNQSTPVFNQNTSHFVKLLLKNTIDNSNLAKLNTTNLDVCGKSGTAQIASDGQYGQDTTASFIAFTPCNNPRYTMSITVRLPKSTPWGASTAAPIWFSIAQKIGLYL